MSDTPYLCTKHHFYMKTRDKYFKKWDLATACILLIRRRDVNCKSICEFVSNFVSLLHIWPAPQNLSFYLFCDSRAGGSASRNFALRVSLEQKGHHFPCRTGCFCQSLPRIRNVQNFQFTIVSPENRHTPNFFFFLPVCCLSRQNFGQVRKQHIRINKRVKVSLDANSHFEHFNKHKM
jgi:hypothetical protein